jgi:hypothetical protein
MLDELKNWSIRLNQSKNVKILSLNRKESFLIIRGNIKGKG